MGDPHESDLHQFIDNLERKWRFQPDSDSCERSSEHKVLAFQILAPTRQAGRGLISPQGDFRGVPVFYSRLLPYGVILSVDREELGTLQVKSDFDIWVSDIRDQQDRESIRKALPRLADADLDEKVRVLCYEIVKATILDKEPWAAFDMVTTKETELQLKTFD